jgi:hypothetical protein
MPSPGWQMLRSVAMDEYLSPVSLRISVVITL